eukprot:88732_1
MTMAMRLSKNQCIMRKYYTFYSLVSTSRFHYKHRYYYYHSNENKLIKSIPNRTNVRDTYFTSSHLTSKHRLHHTSNDRHHIYLHHHTKHHYTNSEMTLQTPYQTGYILHNICESISTFDSITRPRSRGYERLSALCVATKAHLLHFWCGTKLMSCDIANGCQILRKLLNGNATTSRERRELRRVSMDALKFVPMLVIILIPFLEATLPLLLYMFPNMLPSRFQSQNVKFERMKKLSSFFEGCIQKELLDKIKKNEHLSSTQISLMNAECALDNASHSVLSNLCRFMDLNAFGTTTMLRTRLDDAIRQIRLEDEAISETGLDEIPLRLLEQLLRERGMNSNGQEMERMKDNLSKWIQLSSDHQVSFSLLLMTQVLLNQ